MENYAQLPELVKQLEYYLGDTNLSRDQFFYNKISESADGFLLIEFIEKCNKIKQLGATRANILEAIGKSELLEANEAGDSVRRVGNKALPEFRAQKRLKTAAGGVAVNNQTTAVTEGQANTEPVEDPKIMTPLILFIRDIEGIPKNGRALEDAIGEKYQLKVPFARIGTQGDGGHVLFDKFATDQSIVDELTADGFVLGEKTIRFDLGTDRDRDAFLKEHGNHVNRIIKRKFSKKLGKAKRDMKKKWIGALEFEGVKYPSLEAFKSRFKGLITKTKNGSEIPEDGKNLLAALLKYHKNSEQKLANLKGFTVDFHPTFTSTRCFFITREDGSQEDFSYHKCIHNLVNQKNSQ